MIADFHFLRPYWWLALIPALLVWWSLFRKQDAVKAWKALIAPHLLNHLLTGRNQQSRVRPIHLLLVLWLLMILSLSGPSWRMEPSPFAEDASGMVVLLKVTPSMMAEDVQPSRLERAKQKLNDLLKLRQGATTGLIAYSGSAHLVMPLTRDGDIIRIMAEGLAPETMPVEGDALAKGLEMAGTLFRKAGKTGSVLVMADTVSPGQMAELKRMDPQERLPVQFLAVNALGTGVDKGVADAANMLDGQVEMLSVDISDLEGINRRAERRLKTVFAKQSGNRWKDSGYAFLPLIILVSLVWARRGWKVS
jgi:Ca-activated chloride channel homolog